MTPANRRHLTALVAAATKLEAASRLAKEATVDVATWVPVEVREEMQKIAAEIDTFVRRRLISAIDRIP